MSVAVPNIDGTTEWKVWTVKAIRIVAALGMAAVAALIGVPAAHADTGSYLNEIHGNGTIYPMAGLASDTNWIQEGYARCAALRNGEPFDVVAAPQAFNVYFDIGKLVSAAQHNLCPDTLK